MPKTTNHTMSLDVTSDYVLVYNFMVILPIKFIFEFNSVLFKLRPNQSRFNPH
uniref:Uncharacterized protein n=1 Tax=Arundo donax TaxID=35708 RepID=A0A0A9EN50_ARUDO